MSSHVRRRIVDAVTLVRVPLAAVLPAVPPPASSVVFSVAAATDAIDGPLARTWGIADPRGARLDSLADAALVAGASAAMVRTIEPSSRGLVARGAIAVATIRIVNLAVTRIRFGRWSIAHTHANKATGALLAVVGVWALARGRMPVRALAAVGVTGALAAIEELAIVTTAGSDDPDVVGFRRRAA